MTDTTCADELKQKIKVVMFDQYGTVVDMQKGLTEIAAPFLQAKGWTGNPAPSSPGGSAPTSRTR